MSGLSGWLLCLVNLLVFSALVPQGACIIAARCLYYHNMVLVLSLQGACTTTTWCLYCRCKVLVLLLQGGLYYRCKVACTTTTWCLWPHYKPHSTGTLLTNRLAGVSFKACFITSALSLHRNYSAIRRINYY